MIRMVVFLVGLSILGGVVFHSILSTSEQIQVTHWLNNSGMHGVAKSLSTNTGDDVPGAKELKQFTRSNPGFMDFLHSGLNKLGSATNKISGAMKGAHAPNFTLPSSGQHTKTLFSTQSNGASDISFNDQSAHWNTGGQPGEKWLGGVQFASPSKASVHDVGGVSCRPGNEVSFNSGGCN